LIPNIRANVCPKVARTYRDLLRCFDLKVTLCHQLLQPRVLRVQLAQATHVLRLQLAEPLRRSADRLLADPVALRHFQTGARSASRVIPTIFSSVALNFRFSLVEISAAGQWKVRRATHQDGNRRLIG
jgi:hypothetical protein